MDAPPFIDAALLHEVLSYSDAIAALERVFSEDPLPDTPQRAVLSRAGGQLLVMPSWGEFAAGVKLVTVNSANPERGLPLIQGVYVLFSTDTLAPVAVFDAAPLTALRTASVSALATRYLAPDDASRLVIFGAGVQAEAHAHALGAVRSLDDVAIVAPRHDASEALAAAFRAAGVPARTGRPEDVADADIVCTCTTSTKPVFDGNLLRPRAHVNAVGSHHPEAREMDTTTVANALVVVETLDSALAEAGDVIAPLAEGAIQQSELLELGRVIREQPRPAGRTVFKSVGVAFEDLAVAAAAFERVQMGRNP